jgi:GntR family transcriptional repressor for pyruvate dehydrogenase complex
VRNRKRSPAVNPLAKSFLTPVSRSTLTADICRKLLSHLIRGDWSEGERIPPERELCQHLGVGRVSLREALKALEIMGMIETRLGDGTFVCQRSEFLSRPLLWAIAASDLTEAQELVEARQLIEVELVGFAAERATAEDLQELQRHLDKMGASLRNAAVFLAADINFHLAVGQAAHNRILQNALQLIRNLMQQWIGETLAIDGVATEALKQHKQILVAITKRRAAQARAAMQLHLETMGRHLTEKRTRNAAARSAKTKTAKAVPS